ncbi:hypothetical protein [Winogradskyella costae]|uniref:hypothetical protein n=1 Tax=Winogradskyella costae TaxID=2697008 RepID=UPI0015CC9A18|nr:hypothetical protein [Winogradskyella costae]
MVIWSYVGVIVVLWVLYRFLKRLGVGIPILELLLLISGLQWVVGAFIEYRTSFEHYKYYMYVDETTYMSYVVPAYIFFVVTLLVISKKTKDVSLNLSELSKYSLFGIYLLILGFSFDLISNVVPNSLKFIVYLISGFKYVGVTILFFSKKKRHVRLFYIGLLLLLVKSLVSAMFHELILWGTFFYMFWALKNKTTFRINITVIIIGFMLSTVIQAVKMDYRTLIWNGYQGNYASLFLDVLNKRLSGGLSENSEEQEELNVRLNQGWIISAIMEYTPRVQPFAEGETVNEAVFASILPRFLSPNKKIAGGVDNFEKYTGLELEENTSMGMSLVGEGYANYGPFGGGIFMGVWGILIACFWNFIFKRINKNQIILFFLPLLFLQVVKAETELVVVLNHIIKATVLVFGFLWFTNTVLRIKFKDE